MTKIKINKRILRCEYAQIAPNKYMPDWDTQVRFTPGLIIETIYLYVGDYMEEHFVLPGNPAKGKAIKQTSVHRVLLTKALLKEVHKRPQWQKDIVFDLDDADKVLDILDSCIEAAENTLPELSWKQIGRIWNMIKCAYGGAHSPPDAAVFDIFVEVTDL